jgi:hypothetical protein
LLLKAKAESTPALVASVTRPAHHLASGAMGRPGAAATAATASAPEPESEPEPEPAPKPEKVRKPKKEKVPKDRGGIKKWFEGFLSEPLDGDEDF